MDLDFRKDSGSGGEGVTILGSLFLNLLVKEITDCLWVVYNQAEGKLGILFNNEN